jgi:hypothetical protein
MRPHGSHVQHTSWDPPMSRGRRPKTTLDDVSKAII